MAGGRVPCVFLPFQTPLHPCAMERENGETSERGEILSEEGDVETSVCTIIFTGIRADMSVHCSGTNGHIVHGTDR